MPLIAEFQLPSEPGNDRRAADRVCEALGRTLDDRQLERLRTAVAEATLNAMEHGNHFDPSLCVAIRVDVTDEEARVRVTDHGCGPEPSEYEAPDLDRKLAGLQSPRGWGLFLIRELVDGVRDEVVQGRHVVEMTIRLAPGHVAG